MNKKGVSSLRMLTRVIITKYIYIIEYVVFTQIMKYIYAK